MAFSQDTVIQTSMKTLSSAVSVIIPTVNVINSCISNSRPALYIVFFDTVSKATAIYPLMTKILI